MSQDQTEPQKHKNAEDVEADRDVNTGYDAQLIPLARGLVLHGGLPLIPRSSGGRLEPIHRFAAGVNLWQVHFSSTRLGGQAEKSSRGLLANQGWRHYSLVWGFLCFNIQDDSRAAHANAPQRQSLLCE